jgi:hypothetical protein
MAIRLSKVPLTGIQPKRWGFTISTAISDRPIHVAYAQMKAGEFSSVHYHEFLYNRFFLITGRLLIEVFRGEAIEKVEVLPLQTLDIEPGQLHRMAAIENCQLIEIYWAEDSAATPNFEDIVRMEDDKYPKPALDGDGGPSHNDMELIRRLLQKPK